MHCRVWQIRCDIQLSFLTSSSSFRGVAPMDGDSLHFRRATPQDAATVIRAVTEMAKDSEDVELDHATVSRGVETVLQNPSKGFYFVGEAGDPSSSEERRARACLSAHASPAAATDHGGAAAGRRGGGNSADHL